MKIVSCVLPVLVMIGVGMICRKLQLLTREGTRDLKKLITTIVLPVALFHALATAEYNQSMLVLFVCILASLFLSFGVGFLIRPLLPGAYRKYLPFIVAVYEGGMIAFPLYMNLFGEENLANIAIFDIATMLFCFSVFVSVLQSTESGEKANVSGIVKNALRTPAFIAVMFGIVCGLTGVVKALLVTDFGPAYLATKNAVTVILNSLILITVGYDFAFDKKRMMISLRGIGLRIVVQSLLLIPFVFIIKYLYPGNLFMLGAVFIYFSAPPSFSIPSYVKSEDVSEFIATTNSLYMVVTLTVYAAVAYFVL